MLRKRHAKAVNNTSKTKVSWRASKNIKWQGICQDYFENKPEQLVNGKGLRNVFDNDFHAHVHRMYPHRSLEWIVKNAYIFAQKNSSSYHQAPSNKRNAAEIASQPTPEPEYGFELVPEAEPGPHCEFGTESEPETDFEPETEQLRLFSPIEKHVSSVYGLLYPSVKWSAVMFNYFRNKPKVMVDSIGERHVIDGACREWIWNLYYTRDYSDLMEKVRQFVRRNPNTYYYEPVVSITCRDWVVGYCVPGDDDRFYLHTYIAQKCARHLETDIEEARNQFHKLVRQEPLLFGYIDEWYLPDEMNTRVREIGIESVTMSDLHLPRNPL